MIITNQMALKKIDPIEKQLAQKRALDEIISLRKAQDEKIKALRAQICHEKCQVAAKKQKLANLSY